MRRHIFQSLCCHDHCDILSPPVSLRFRQVDVEVPCHQQLGAPEELLERGNDTLYCRCVVEGEVTYHNVPPLLPRFQMEANEIGSELLDGLHRKIWRRLVEHCHSVVVSDWRVRRNNAIPSRPAGVDAVSDLCLLEDSQVHVGLGHPPQRQLQSPVTTVTDLVGAAPT